jgi:SAM-dependent methyltransferase
MRRRRLGACAALLLAAILLSACSTAPDSAAPDSGPKSADSGNAAASPAKPAESNPEPKTAPMEKEPDVVYVPTPQDVVDMMLHLARVRKKDRLLDLGCGDGRIVVTAARRYGCRAEGYDIDPDRVKESWENVRKNRVQKLVRIEQKDIFTLDLSRATVVTLYLLPELNVRLIPQLKKLKPGSRIVSHEFDMEGVEPDMTLTMWSREDDALHEIYLWKAPLKTDEDEAEEGTKEEETGRWKKWKKEPIGSDEPDDRVEPGEKAGESTKDGKKEKAGAK